jgi:hypothetical protein
MQPLPLSSVLKTIPARGKNSTTVKYTLSYNQRSGEKKIEDDAQRWRGSQPAMEDDVDNDIGPGCYVLDLNIELKCSKLWVRKDYIRIYDYCTMRHEEGPRYVKQRARSVVITGQPGVGVSFLTSLLCTL